MYSGNIFSYMVVRLTTYIMKYSTFSQYEYIQQVVFSLLTFANKNSIVLVIFSANDSPEQSESTQFEIEVENDPTFVSNDETRETQEFNQNVEVKTEEVTDAEKSEENGEYTPDDVTEFIGCFPVVGH